MRATVSSLGRRAAAVALALAAAAVSLAVPGAARAAAPAPADLLPGLPGPAAALLATGSEGGPLPVAVLAFRLPAAPDRVAVLVEVPADLLAETTTASPAEPQPPGLEVYAVGLDPAGGVRGFLAAAVALPGPEAAAPGGVEGVRLLGLVTAPGAVTLRVLAWAGGPGLHGLRRVELPPPASPLPWPPLVAPLAGAGAAPSGGWLVFQAGTDPGLDDLASRTWLSALPVLAAGGPFAVELPGRGAGAAGATARWTAADGRELERSGLTPATDGPTAGPGEVRLAGRVPDLAPGVYRLAVELDGATSPAAAIAIAPAPALEPWPSIAALRTYRPAAPEAARRPAAPARRPRRDDALARQVRDRYRRALARLAGGDPPAAVAEGLAAAHRELVAAARAEPFDAVDRAEIAAAIAWSAPDRESLVPLCALHARLYRDLAAGGEPAIAESARRAAAGVCGAYAAAAAPATPAAPLAAALLVDLAAAMLDQGVEDPSRQLLERAVALDPASDTARLLLAARRERDGDYAGVVAVLRPLAARHPCPEAGCLRLAVNLARAGDAAGATALARRLIGEARTPWVLAVAYEELARGERRSGAGEAAVRWLREGRGRLPREPQLELQLAALLDRLGSRAEASAILAGMSTAATATPPAARHLYAVWPDVSALRPLVESAALLRLPALARALAAAPPAPAEPGRPRR